MKPIMQVKSSSINEVQSVLGLSLCKPIESEIEKKRQLSPSQCEQNILQRFLHGIWKASVYLREQWELAEMQDRKLRAIKDEMYRNYFPGSHIK